jgi:hypothetical protein
MVEDTPQIKTLEQLFVHINADIIVQDSKTCKISLGGQEIELHLDAKGGLPMNNLKKAVSMRRGTMVSNKAVKKKAHRVPLGVT